MLRARAILLAGVVLWASSSETGAGLLRLGQLAPHDATTDDVFGSAVAIHGNTVIVGAPGLDSQSAQSRPGAAYVFDVPTHSERLKLSASDASDGDQFGVAVAIGGNLAVVGAPRNDAECPEVPDCDSGSAYVFA